MIYGLVCMREGAVGAGRRTGELGAFVWQGACPVLPQVVLPENRDGTNGALTRDGLRHRRPPHRTGRLCINCEPLATRLSHLYLRRSCVQSCGRDGVHGPRPARLVSGSGSFNLSYRFTHSLSQRCPEQENAERPSQAKQKYLS